jgi:hypothetical protein
LVGEQQNIVTIVVAWDPDSVYSSSIHNNREEADSVYLQLEKNVNADIPYIPIARSLVVDSGNGGLELSDEEFADLRPIGRPVETVHSDVSVGRNKQATSKGPGVTLLRGRPTAFTGGAATGPQEAPLNALRAQFSQAPANSEATQGDMSILTMLQSAGSPAAYMERVLDGQGGAYGHQLQAALGRFARINANLSWEYDSLADVLNWDTTGPSSFSFGLTGFPRKLEVSHDGSGGGTGGAVASPLLAPDSLGAFSITFHGVDYTDNDSSNNITLAVSDVSADTNARSTGTGVAAIFSPNDADLFIHENGTELASLDGENIDFSQKQDITIRSTSSGFEILVGGDRRNSTSKTVSGAMSPLIQLGDNGAGTGETLTVEQITVEPLPEVLQ